MTGVYGTAERARLVTLADQLTATGVQGSSLPRTLADRLRNALPDLDDVTIGRVLLAVTAGMAATWEPVCEGRVPANTLWQGLAAAGLDLTRDEWNAP